VISRKFAITHLGADIIPDIGESARQSPVVKAMALGRTVEGRDWVEVQLGTQGSGNGQSARFLVTVEEDPPFDMIFGTEQEPGEDSHDGTRQNLRNNNSGSAVLSQRPTRVFKARGLTAELTVWLQRLRKFWNYIS